MALEIWPKIGLSGFLRATIIYFNWWWLELVKILIFICK